MPRFLKWSCALALGVLATTGSPEAFGQYAVGHRTFGIGTVAGVGYSRMDYQFPGIEPGEPFYLLPTLEMKVFLGDRLSIDLSVPVVNIAASQALQDYFFVTGDIYLNFHPSAPHSSWELFAAVGLGVDYASWEGEDENGQTLSESGYAFHIPARVGMEFNNRRRNFSLFVAARPFFSLVRGGSDETRPGGGGMLEVGIMAYTIQYQADRY